MDYLLDGTFVMRNGKIDKYLFDGGYAQATTGAYTDSFAFYHYLKDNLAGKTVFVGACNVGQNAFLVQHIAEDTGALVIAAQHKIPAGFTYDGSNFLNQGPLIDPQSSQYTKSDGINTSTRTNFTIDKNLGTFWDGKHFFE